MTEWDGKPTQAALLYLVLGTFSLFLSDVLLVEALGDRPLLSQIQALKGGIEVLLTAGFIFVMMRYSRSKLEESLSQAREREQELAVLHRVFRHNLRNSLNVILGYTRQARLRTDDPEQRAALETASANVREVHHLVEQVVRIQKLANSETDRVDVDIVPVVRSLVEDYRRETGAHVDVSLPETALARTHSGIELAIDELIDNAVAHSDVSPPTVRIEVEPAGTSPSRVRIVISDDGPGMPPETQRILESTDVEDSHHLATLGLWTAYWVVTRSGGSFDIENTDPRGCRISILLPSGSTAE
jgi:signal transduction histidine kinase